MDLPVVNTHTLNLIACQPGWRILPSLAIAQFIVAELW